MYSGSQGSSFEGGPSTSSRGPKDSFADSTYNERRASDLGLTRRETEATPHVDVKASRGTLIDIFTKTTSKFRNNSDNEVIDLAKYYSDQAKEA